MDMLEDISVEQVLRLHQAGAGLIQSVSCIVSRTADFPKPDTITAKYWRKGQSIRVKEYGSNNSYEADGLSKDFVSVKFSRSPGGAGQGEHIGAVREAGQNPFLVCNLPFELLQTFVRFPRNDVTLAQLLETPHQLIKTGFRKENGRELVQLDLSVTNPADPKGTWDFEFWIDPSVNHQVCKLITRINGEQHDRAERDIVRFLEPVPGVFFPTESKHTTFKNNKAVSTIVTRVSELKINEPIDDAIFTLEIPVGAQVTDKIAGTSYKKAEGGSNVNTVADPLARQQSVVAGTATTPGSLPPTPWNESHPESSGNVLWYAMSVVFVVVALCALKFQFRKTTSPKPRKK